jgi:hypothetical protein
MEEALRDALLTVHVTPQGKAAATRALVAAQRADPSIDLNDGMIKLACALRAVKGEQCRITAKLLNQWRQKIVATTTLKQTFWAVPKAMNPKLLDTDLAKFLVDVASIHEWPPNVNPAKFFILDQAAPRSSLGLGVMEIELALGRQKTQDLDEPAAGGGQHMLRAEGDDSASASVNVPVAAKASAPVPEPVVEVPCERPASRVLRAQSSDAKSDDEIAEDIAKSTKEAFEKGLFYVTDPNVPTTVEFWLRSFKYFVSNGDGKDVLESRPHMQQYLKFVVKSLLASAASCELGQIAPLLQQIGESRPALLPALGRALVELASFNLAIDSEVKVSFLDMPQRNTFFRSSLYTSFLDARWRSRLQAVQSSVDLTGEQRRADRRR